VDRIQANPDFVVNSLNIHRLLITSVMLAAKFFDDHYFNNAFFARIGGVSREEMNQLELEFLFMIGFSLTVDEQEYQAYNHEIDVHAGALRAKAATPAVSPISLSDGAASPPSSAPVAVMQFSSQMAAAPTLTYPQTMAQQQPYSNNGMDWDSDANRYVPVDHRRQQQMQQAIPVPNARAAGHVHAHVPVQHAHPVNQSSVYAFPHTHPSHAAHAGYREAMIYADASAGVVAVGAVQAAYYDEFQMAAQQYGSRSRSHTHPHVVCIAPASMDSAETELTPPCGVQQFEPQQLWVMSQ